MESSQSPLTPTPEALAVPEGVVRDLGFSGFLAQADAVILGVLAILLIMSIATWYLVLSNGIRTWLWRRRAVQVVNRFWGAGSLPQAVREIERLGLGDAFSELVMQGINADAHYRRHCPQTLGESCTHSEFVTRALRQGISRATAHLEGGLTVLASVGSTAPFVGLFGTVWGIYHALVRIGMSGQATLDQVAAPVGEALIMTALGLAVAIPAVLAYNGFVRANRVILAELDGFAHGLHAYLTTGARLESGARPASGEQPETATLMHAVEETI